VPDKDNLFFVFFFFSRTVLPLVDRTSSFFSIGFNTLLDGLGRFGLHFVPFCLKFPFCQPSFLPSCGPTPSTFLTFLLVRPGQRHLSFSTFILSRGLLFWFFSPQGLHATLVVWPFPAHQHVVPFSPCFPFRCFFDGPS